MLAALIPKIKLSSEGKCSKLPGFIIVLGLFVSALACLSIASSPEKPMLIKYLLVIVVYPLMLYFASCINFNNGFLNWLGSLSFPIYAFQCILRVVEHYFTSNDTHLFILLIVLVLVYSSVISIINQKKKSAPQNN